MPTGNEPDDQKSPWDQDKRASLQYDLLIKSGYSRYKKNFLAETLAVRPKFYLIL